MKRSKKKNGKDFCEVLSYSLTSRGREIHVTYFVSFLPSGNVRLMPIRGSNKWMLAPQYRAAKTLIVKSLKDIFVDKDPEVPFLLPKFLCDNSDLEAELNFLVIRKDLKLKEDSKKVEGADYIRDLDNFLKLTLDSLFEALNTGKTDKFVRRLLATLLEVKVSSQRGFESQFSPANKVPDKCNNILETKKKNLGVIVHICLSPLL